jgi:hypothetical protein
MKDHTIEGYVISTRTSPIFKKIAQLLGVHNKLNTQCEATIHNPSDQNYHH